MFEIYRRFDNETKKAPLNNPVPRQQATMIRQNQLPMLPAPQHGKTPQTVGNAGVQNYGQPLQPGYQTVQRETSMQNHHGQQAGQRTASMQNHHGHQMGQRTAPMQNHHGQQTGQRTTSVGNKRVRTLKMPSRQQGAGQDRKSAKASTKPFGFLQGLLPASLYDSNNKKLFGFLSAEDLLLVALIFLLLERDGEDNVLLIIALGYILISDYIDLPEFGF